MTKFPKIDNLPPITVRAEEEIKTVLRTPDLERNVLEIVEGINTMMMVLILCQDQNQETTKKVELVEVKEEMIEISVQDPIILEMTLPVEAEVLTLPGEVEERMDTQAEEDQDLALIPNLQADQPCLVTS